MLYKYGIRVRVIFDRIYFNSLSFRGVLNTTIIPLALFGYDVIIASAAPSHAQCALVE